MKRNFLSDVNEKYLVDIAMVEHLVLARRVFVELLAAVTRAVVAQLRRQRPMVAAVVVDVVDCNVHRVVHHRTVDTDWDRRQIVDFVVVLVGTVNPADTVAVVVQLDIVVFRPDLIQIMSN